MEVTEVTEVMLVMLLMLLMSLMSVMSVGVEGLKVWDSGGLSDKGEGIFHLNTIHHETRESAIPPRKRAT